MFGIQGIHAERGNKYQIVMISSKPDSITDSLCRKLNPEVVSYTSWAILTASKLFDEEKYEQSVELYEDVLGWGWDDHISALLCFNIGAAYRNLNKDDDVEKYYVVSIDFDSLFVTTHHYLALLYHKQRRFDEALAEMNIAITLEPSSDRFCDRGNVYYRKEQYTDAKEDYLRAISLPSKEDQVTNNATLKIYWRNAGHCEYMLNNYKDAENDYSNAYQLCSETKDYIYYAETLARQEKISDATRIFEECLGILNKKGEPVPSSVYLNLHSLYAKQGMKRKAKRMKCLFDLSDQ